MTEKKRLIIPENAASMNIERTDTGGKLWHPDQAKPEEKVAYRCLICGEGFPEAHKRSYLEHAPKCASRNEDALNHVSLRNKMPELFDPNKAGDVEYRRWLKRPGNAEAERQAVKKSSGR